MINNSLHTLTNSQSLGQIELCSLTLQRWCGYRKWSPALSVGGLSACVCLCAFCLTLACTSLSVSYPLSWPSSGIHTFILTHILSPQMRPLCQPTCCDITYICVIFFLLSLAVLCAKNLAKKDFFRKYSDCDLFHMHISGIIKSPCDIGATVKTECHWCCSFAVLRDNCWPVVALEYNNDPDCHPTIRGLFKAAKLLRVCPVLFLVRIC